MAASYEKLEIICRLSVFRQLHNGFRHFFDENNDVFFRSTSSFAYCCCYFLSKSFCSSVRPSSIFTVTYGMYNRSFYVSYTLIIADYGEEQSKTNNFFLTYGRGDEAWISYLDTRCTKFLW